MFAVNNSYKMWAVTATVLGEPDFHYSEGSKMFRDRLKRALIYLMSLMGYLLIAIPISLAQEQQHTSGKISIGQKDGLRLTTEIYRQEYRADDVMVITVKFENLTEKNMYISKHQSANVGSFVLYSFLAENRVLSAPLKGLNPNVRYKRPPLPQLSLSDFVLIAPRESHVVDITIHLSDYVLLPEEYLFIVDHESLWSQKEVPELEGVWGQEHGVLYSEITVNGKPLPEPAKIVIR